jgi:methionyl-tRNA formyltransferase
MRTVIVGNRALARHVLSFCLDSAWNVVGVVVPDEETARKQANFTSVADLVSDVDCELIATEHINGDRVQDRLTRLDPDVCLCPGWGDIIDARILEIPTVGFFGFHASRLPEGRGGAPVNWSLIHGATDVWLSLFRYSPGVDAGDVVAQQSVPVETRDDVSTVFDALAAAARTILEDTRPMLEEGSVDAVPQDRSDATYRPRRQPQDGLINWTRDAETQANWVRAQTRPYPGAYTFFDGQRIRVWRGTRTERAADAADPGQVLGIVPESGIDVASADGVFRITRVQPDRGPARWADRYATERGLSVGDRFGRHHAPQDWIYTGIRGPDGETCYRTNLRPGESGLVTVVCYTGSPRDLQVSVTFDNETKFADETTVTETYEATATYASTTPGTYTLAVKFEIGTQQVDRRVLKVFVHE